MLRIEYPDTKAIEVEADDIETLLKLANQALYGLWGNSARQLGLMTLEQADDWLKGGTK